MSEIDQQRIVFLQSKAKQIRRDILHMIFKAKSGHPGGSLSAADILTVLYFDEMRIDPKRPDWPGRDRFILSKGHSCPVHYACLAGRGFFPKKNLNKLRELGSILQGHPDMRKVPGLDMTTGSLGQGLSAGIGMALGAKIDKKDYRVYVMVGDGEIDEGQIWEAIMSAAKFKLDNLTVFMDYNGLQLDGTTEEIMPLEPVDSKLKAFNWNVITIDGNSILEIIDAIERAKKCKDRPTWIIAKTVKGKGVSFMENKLEWHGMAPNEEQLKIALVELE